MGSGYGAVCNTGALLCFIMVYFFYIADSYFFDVMQLLLYLTLFIVSQTYRVGTSSDSFIKIGKVTVLNLRYDTTNLNSGNFRITVISQYITSAQEDRPIFINQQVKLLYNDVEVYNKAHKSNIKTRTIDGEKVDCLENGIIQVGIIEGRGDSVFSISGYGGCMWCTEYDELFNKKGESIYLLYHDKQKVYQSHGSMKAVCSNMVFH